jgi:exosome complex RNA-binding protein Rrp42 (RNase PH superfamily)
MKIARIPKYDEETDTVLYDQPTDEKLPLTDHIPVAVSVHKIGKSLVVDPTREEEDLSETRVTIGSSNGVISSLQKSNSQYLEIDEMKRVFEISTEISKEIYEKIEKALE